MTPVSAKKIQRLIASVSIVLLFMNMGMPFLLSQPKPVYAGGGFLPLPLPVIKLWPSPQDIVDRILRILADRLRTLLVRQIQRIVLDFFRQISSICPPYLRYRGTDVCRKIVGDWRNFFRDAITSADVELANEIGASSLPRNWRSALISALLPIDDPGISRGFTRAGGLPRSENTWQNFSDSLDPQRNILGQLLLTHDEQLKRAQEMVEAAKEEGRAGRGFIGQKKCKLWGRGIDDTPQCALYDDDTPAATQEQIVMRVAVADLDLILTARELDQIIGALIDTLITRMFGGLGLFSASVPSGSVGGDPCAGLTGEAMRICREAQGMGTSPTPTPTPSPSPGAILFTANPTSIVEGQSSTLSWAAPEAPSCEASDGWSGTRPNIGVQIVTPPNTTTYALTCDGNSASVTVNVRPGMTGE